MLTSISFHEKLSDIHLSIKIYHSFGNAVSDETIEEKPSQVTDNTQLDQGSYESRSHSLAFPV